MNWHKRGDELEEACKAWFEHRWPGKHTIIVTKKNSIHGIDFAVETARGDVFIVESKSATGALSQGQFTLEWIGSRVNPDLYNALSRTVLRNRDIIREVVRVIKRPDGKFEFREEKYDFKIGSPTGHITWEELFPGRPRPKA